jgi:hypothetical protein
LCVFKLMRTQQVLQKLWRLQPTRICQDSELCSFEREIMDFLCWHDDVQIKPACTLLLAGKG